MKRIFTLIIFVFSINVFGLCTQSYLTKNVSSYSACYDKVGMYYNTSTAIWSNSSENSNRYCNGILDYKLISGSTYSCKYSLVVTPFPTCPVNETYDTETCTCVSNTCSWATTPPWIQTFKSQSECHNGNKERGISHEWITYLWNFRWCEVNSKCYGLEYSCPTGQIYDSFDGCRPPKTPYQPDCGSCGTYKQSGSIEGPAGKTCFIDYICKCNPNIRSRIEVSCGAGPIEPDPEDPLHPTEDPEPNPSGAEKNPNDHSAMCGTKRMLAKSQCDSQPGKVLKFSCNPLNGDATSSCEYPDNQPQQNPIDDADNNSGSTSADIKELGNNLPENIKRALSQYFTDGSMPYLGSIKGSLDSIERLDADRNTKLDSISASVDGQLVLQSEANAQLDRIASDTERQKFMIEPFFTDQTEYDGEEMPTNGDMSPDSNTTDGFDTFTNSITSVKDQFNQAQAIFSGGVPAVDFGGGSCPTYSFMGKSVSIASIGQSIAPYSSIFSILIYISLMINIFRMIFGFFSKGV